MIWLCYNIMFVYCYWGGFLLFIRRPCKQLYIHYVNKITIRMQEYIGEVAKSKEKGPHEKRVTQSHDRGAFRGILNIVCWSSLFFNKFGIIIHISSQPKTKEITWHTYSTSNNNSILQSNRKGFHPPPPLLFKEIIHIQGSVSHIAHFIKPYRDS